MTTTRASLGELALVFLKLGTTAFGGPAAHIAMMEEETVRRRRWLTREEFLDYLGAAHLIPGPNSTELAIHIGRARAGWRGLLVAGACFILPAAVIVLAIAWAYVRWGRLPAAGGVLYGIKPVVIAVVVQALWSLGRTAVKSRTLGGIGLIALIAAAAGVHEILVLAGAALAAVLVHQLHGRATAAVILTLGPVAAGTEAIAQSAARIAMSPATAAGLFAVFARIGAVLFGSGYVLLAFLRAELVERRGWLGEATLIDAVAVGQVTPGPVFTTATFIGYVLDGAGGALAATVGIFLPAFVFVAISGPLIPRLRRSPTAGAVLDAVNVASLALMALVTVQLGRAALVDVPTALLALASAALLLRWRVNSAWLVLGGAVAGLALAA